MMLHKNIVTTDKKTSDKMMLHPVELLNPSIFTSLDLTIASLNLIVMVFFL